MSEFYDQTSQFQEEQFQNLRRLIEKFMPEREKIKSLLDIGAGTCTRTIQCFDIFPHLSHITALEPNPEMMAVAQKKYFDPRIDYHLLAAENLSLLQEKYDLILSNWAFHWIPDKEKMLADLQLLLKKGTYLVFSTCEKLPSILKMIDDFIRPPSQKSPFFYLTYAEWKTLLSQFGWEIVAFETSPVVREISDAENYLDMWIAASTEKCLYQQNLNKAQKSALKDKMIEHFPSRNKGGVLISEDVLLTIARNT